MGEASPLLSGGKLAIGGQDTAVDNTIYAFTFSLVCVENVQSNKRTKKRTRGLVSKEIVVLLRWEVETNAWFINRVD